MENFELSVTDVGTIPEGNVPSEGIDGTVCTINGNVQPTPECGECGDYGTGDCVFNAGIYF